MSQIESNKLPVWEYNGVELVLDMTDPDVVERYEDTFTLMDKEVKAAPKDGKKSDAMRYYCKMLRNVFDRIFGEGTSNKLVGEKNSAAILTDCYESFLDYVSKQNDAMINAQNRMTNRYSPNRAQRRSVDKKS